jgi:DNA invertase Pin-like site-specific DNA recombinase
MAGRWVSYRRISTERQRISGLGLDAQAQAVAAFLRANGGVCVADFVERESGRNNNRSELLKALAACRMHGASLLIARIDRLSRNAAFLLSLRDSGVDFIAADLPGASRLTIGILALVAEAEADAISARTRGALAAAKRRGVKLGNSHNFTDAGRLKGREVARATLSAGAKQRAADRLAHVEDLRAAGRTTAAEIARGLTERGVPTPRGRADWQAIQVTRLLARLAG